MAAKIVARGGGRGRGRGRGSSLGSGPFFFPHTEFPLIAAAGTAAATATTSISARRNGATSCSAVAFAATTRARNAEGGGDAVDLAGVRRPCSVGGRGANLPQHPHPLSLGVMASRRLDFCSSHLTAAGCSISRSAGAHRWRDGPCIVNPTLTTCPFPSQSLAVSRFSTSVGWTSGEEQDEVIDDDDGDVHGNKFVVTSVEADFFGEPVTFLRRSRGRRRDGEGHEIEIGVPGTSTAAAGGHATTMGALDDFILAVVTGGQSADDGGDSEGVGAQAGHSSAIVWSALLRHACDGVPVGCDADADADAEANAGGDDDAPSTISSASSSPFSSFSPMLAAAAVAPLLIQGGGVRYVRHLDDVLRKETDDRGINLLSLARYASSMRHSPALTPRERYHLDGLQHLLRDEPCDAMWSYTRAVQFCPGDCLALSLALQLSHVLGNARAALRAGASVATYWEERGRAGTIGSGGMGGAGGGGGHLISSIPGHTVGTAYVALGLAAGGRHREAELLAERCLKRDSSSSGGIANHALSIVYEAEGRTAEGASLLAGYDGVGTYEHCGFLFLDARLGGIGARFILDRDGMAGGDSNSGAVRLYDEHFDRVLTRHRGGTDYRRHCRAPRTSTGLLKRATRSMFGSLWFGGGNDSPSGDGRSGRVASGSDASGDAKAEETNRIENSPRGKDETLQRRDALPSQAESEKHGDNDDRDADSEQAPRQSRPLTPLLQLEDVFARLPPTPQFLADATLLLLRLTLAGVVGPDDARWTTLRVAWMRCRSLPEVEERGDGGTASGDSSRAKVTRRPWSQTLPLADAVSALLIGEGMESPPKVGCHGITRGVVGAAGLRYCDNAIDLDDEDDGRLTHVRRALALMGRLMRLGVDMGEDEQNGDGQDATRNKFTTSENDPDENADSWKMVVHHLASATEGRADDPSLSSSSRGGGGFGWDQDVRPILEHSLCHAASLSNDYECYCIARAVCSEGVTLRPNCPEVWWRYGVVLDELGDDVAAQDAREASRMFGGGSGGVGAH